jgi:3-hydroxybutyryl-CoA dehydrogenase
MKIKRALVVGAGNMGVGIATDLARAGIVVRLISRTAARREKAHSALAALADELARELDEKTDWQERISISVDSHDVQPDIVIEAIVEDAKKKNALFRNLEREFLGVSIWSTTSAIPASDMVEGLAHPERVIVAHYANPAHLMPIVEVAPGPATSEVVTRQCLESLRVWGKHPVLVRDEPPGFIFNRLQYAVLREAVSLVSSGAISAEDLDTVVAQGYGLRLPVVGPLAMVDLSTLPVYARIAKLILPDLENAKELALLDQMAAAGETFLSWSAGQQDGLRAKLRRELLMRLRQRERNDRTD